MAEKTFYESYVKNKQSIETPEQIANLYDNWAPTYNKELASDHGKWPAPGILAEKLNDVMEKDGNLHNENIRILDICGGTGKLAQEVRKRGISKAKIDGHDGSMEMLKVAQENKIYDNIFQALLYGDRDASELLSCTYDYVIAVGCFNNGGLDRECFRHLYNAAKAGGKIIFAVTINYYDVRFDQVLERYESAGKIKIMQKTLMPEYIKMMDSEDPRGMMVVVEKIA